ncbi:GyrI-like domain-containing protein [Desulfovibrio sp. JC010]|uniref:AraC family transcriptional regulator n=1 Tax=Desulfovibrio sp. JC010 TaxID=2593641 RepID=UPI0013D53D42|nr:AraC family transcriptional regulator [Desulfovibrio sp. JC010]NDV25473.1 AraC family transcriptional regulator [Desulfovibrio sp. JC010]
MSTLLQPYNERMMEVLLYIQRNLDGDLSPETLAEQACFSVAHFHRIFKGMIGESLKEHVRRLRLERAAYRLCYSDDSVMDIALDSGFESPETFSRAFKKRFLVPPSDFRNSSRAILGPGNDGKIHYRPDPSIEGFELDDSPAKCKVEIRTREETQVVFIRHVGPYFGVEKAWEKLCGWGYGNGLMTNETEFLGLSYDDPDITPEEKIRYDACFTIQNEVETPPEMGLQIIPGGRFAVTTHYGSYEGLHTAYREFYGKWLPSSGHQVKNTVPSFEKYIKVPPDVPPEEAVTEIWLAIY